jgi:hypothetical protein
MAEKKKYDYSRFQEIRVSNVPKTMKETIKQDRKQQGLSESALVKNIISDHYRKNPLIINPAFLED